MATVTKDVATFKRVYRKTGTIRSAALAAGYSVNCSSTGMQHLPKVIRTYVLTRRKKLAKLAAMATQIDANMQEDIVRGALLANVASGKDQACNSLKMLGQDKRVAMFQPESTTGVIIIQAAPIPSFDTIPGVAQSND